MNTGCLSDFCVFFNFFHQCVLLFSIQIFTTLVKFIPKYFNSLILFDVIVSGIFLISFSDNLLLMYKNATDFCMLILYPETLLNLFVLIVFFFKLASLGFSLYEVMSSTNRENFTFCFLMWMPFISFSFLIALASCSRIILDRCSKSEHSCLFPEPVG